MQKSLVAFCQTMVVYVCTYVSINERMKKERKERRKKEREKRKKERQKERRKERKEERKKGRKEEKRESNRIKGKVFAFNTCHRNTNPSAPANKNTHLFTSFPHWSFVGRRG